MRESFVFYRSFYEAIKKLPDGFQLELYNVIMEYVFNDEIIEMTPVVEAMFELVKINIDKAKERYDRCVENGKKGGRPKTKTKPTENQNETKTKPSKNQGTNQDANLNDNVNVNVNENVNENVNVIRRKNIPPTLQEVTDYINEKKLNVDAKTFFNYFDTGNWIDSNGNKVKNWKQKLITWNNYKPVASNNKDVFANRYYDETNPNQYADVSRFYIN